MKKYFIIIILFLTSQSSALSQDVDSLTIVGLKKKLTSLKDTARINCLLDIAGEYSNWGHDKTDSVRIYLTTAKDESEKIGYKYGIAASLLFAAGNEVFVTKDLIAAEKYINQAKTLGESINDPKLLGWVALMESELYIRRKDPGLIDLFKKALTYFQKAGDIEGQAEASNWIGSQHLWQGEYEQAFPYCERSVALSKLPRTHKISWGYFLVQFSLSNMSQLYGIAGDYETAMNYLKESNAFAVKYKTNWSQYADIAELYSTMGQYDSTMVYWNKWRNDPAWVKSASGHKAYGNNILATVYIKTNRYDEAIPLSKNSLDTFIAIKNFAGSCIPLLALAEEYVGKKQYKTALHYVTTGIDTARKYKLLPQEIQGYKILSSIQYELGDHKKAYVNLLKYMKLKDSVENKKFLLQLNNYKKKAEEAQKETRIGFLNKDNKIKEQQLKQQATVKNFLVAIFIAFILIGVFVYRNLRLKRKNEKLRRERAEDELKVQQLESEKKHSELQQQATELEMQALRAQMNPHFIFNCLSSINRFILKNETEAASDYLTRFSRLIRMVLINSQKSLITLEDELEMLRLYLDMERLRFKNSFDYNINFKNTIDAGAIFIPPLLLQPFCENAIWHGLMQKDGNGELDISMNMQDNILKCTITDNGIGREKAAELKSKSAEKEKSLGLKITTERLALFNEGNGAQTNYMIEDIYDEKGNAAGTKVKLQIRYKESVEEYISN
ncbi:MAG: histidine kinase [Bacteroidota bacterium]|nr:histidine kinase [Bacteroidota bacterium]